MCCCCSWSFSLKLSTKSCGFVVGDARPRNTQSLAEDCLTVFSCSRCIVYGFNTVYYVWIVPSVFSAIKVFYFLFGFLLRNKDDQFLCCCCFFRCILNLTTQSVVCLHSEGLEWHMCSWDWWVVAHHPFMNWQVTLYLKIFPWSRKDGR